MSHTTEEQITIKLPADTARRFAESYPSDGGYIEAVGSAIRAALTELDPPKPLEVGMKLLSGRDIYYVNHEVAIYDGGHFYRIDHPIGLNLVDGARHPWPDPPVDEQKERYREALERIAERSATWASMVDAEPMRSIAREALEASE